MDSERKGTGRPSQRPGARDLVFDIWRLWPFLRIIRVDRGLAIWIGQGDIVRETRPADRQLPSLTMAACWIALLFVATAAALPQYRDNIPNGAQALASLRSPLTPSPGHSVPCPPGAFGCLFNICNGVGHNSCTGGGPLNAFGTAFEAAGYAWTPALCAADSDGDGLSNGLELGDPCCVWVKGATPAGVALSHPGFASDGALHRTLGLAGFGGGVGGERWRQFGVNVSAKRCVHRLRPYRPSPSLRV